MLASEVIKEACRLKSGDERHAFAKRLREEDISNDDLLRLYQLTGAGSPTATQRCDDMTLFAIADEFKRRGLALPESLAANHPHYARCAS